MSLDYDLIIIMSKKQKIIAQVRDNSVFLIPVFLVLLIAPTIVYMRAVEQSELAKSFWKGGKVTYDFFCYYKTLTLRLCASFGILFILTQKFLYGFKFKFEKKLMIPLLIYLFFGLISTLFSEYQEFAWLGFPDRFEGYLSIISYAVILYMVYDLGEHTRVQKWVLWIMVFLAILLSIIGIFQYYHMDFFQTNFGKELILPSEFEYAANKLSFHQSNPVYMTLYQSNFAGSFTAIVFSMSFVGVFLLKSKLNRLAYYGFVLLHLLTFSVWIACDSRAGLVGGVVALITALYFMRKLIKKNWKLVGGLLVAYSLLMAGILHKPKNVIFTRYQIPDEIGEKLVLEDLKIEKNIIKIKTSHYQMSILHNGRELLVFDDKNTRLKVEMPQQGVMKINDPRYASVIMRLVRVQNDKVYLQFIMTNSSVLTFYYEPNGNFVLYDLARMKIIPLKPVPALGNMKTDHLASNRGYIWARSIPMLLNNLVIGNGFDTFAAHFPQHDIIGKSMVWYSTGVIIEKPHNFFLDIGLSAGVPALMAFLVFLFFVLSKSSKLISQDLTQYNNQLRLVLMMGVVSFLTCAQFNDSIVSVSIIFWVLLGLLMNLNSSVPDQSPRSKTV